jgi:hypothetical protein
MAKQKVNKQTVNWTTKALPISISATQSHRPRAGHQARGITPLRVKTLGD